MSEKPVRKVQFGCGPNKLEGWENYDIEVDISKPLDPKKFPADSIDKIYLSHVLEHVTHLQAFDFFEECKRILKPHGSLRIVVPSVERIAQFYNRYYGDFQVEKGWAPDNSKKAAMRSILANHGHQGAWSMATLAAFYLAHDFERIVTSQPNQPEDLHWKAIGRENDHIESIGIIGYKPLILR